MKTIFIIQCVCVVQLLHCYWSCRHRVCSLLIVHTQWSRNGTFWPPQSNSSSYSTDTVPLVYYWAYTPGYYWAYTPGYYWAYIRYPWFITEHTYGTPGYYWAYIRYPWLLLSIHTDPWFITEHTYGTPGYYWVTSDWMVEGFFLHAYFWEESKCTMSTPAFRTGGENVSSRSLAGRHDPPLYSRQVLPQRGEAWNWYCQHQNQENTQEGACLCSLLSHHSIQSIPTFNNVTNSMLPSLYTDDTFTA